MCGFSKKIFLAGQKISIIIYELLIKIQAGKYNNHTLLPNILLAIAVHIRYIIHGGL